SHWSFRRPLPPVLRYRPRCHFRQARARLLAVSRQPAATTRSACPVAHTAPACDAKPHGYPSYIPLRLTLGLDKGKVNGKAIANRYRSNRGKGYGAGFKAVFESGWAKDTKQLRRSRGGLVRRGIEPFPAKAIKPIKYLVLKSKAPPCGGAMRCVFWADHKSEV